MVYADGTCVCWCVFPLWSLKDSNRAVYTSRCSSCIMQTEKYHIILRVFEKTSPARATTESMVYKPRHVRRTGPVCTLSGPPTFSRAASYECVFRRASLDRAVSYLSGGASANCTFITGCAENVRDRSVGGGFEPLVAD